MSHQKPCMFSQVDNAIEELSRVKKNLDECFITLGNMSQEAIDTYIEEKVNPTINKKLEELRESLLESLRQQYQAFKTCSESLDPINSASPTDLGSVISFCNAVKDFIIGAYDLLMTFMTLLPEHLVRLTSAIVELVTYTPPISGINFDKLDIQMEPIKLSDITGE